MRRQRKDEERMMDRGYLTLQGLAVEPPRGVSVLPVALASVAPPPLDRHNAVYLGMVLAGVGFLLPYNSFIIAVDYFQDKYPGSTIIFDMSLVYILSAFGSVLLNNMLVEVLSMNIRICIGRIGLILKYKIHGQNRFIVLLGYAISFSVLMFITVFEVWLDVLPKEDAYRIILLSISLLAVGCTVQQSSFYGYTSMLPTRYTQAVMAGESAAGFIISVSRILTKTLIEDIHTNTMYFFGLSLMIVVACIFSYSHISESDFVSYYIQICQPSKGILTMRPGDTPMITTPTRINENSERENSNTSNGEGPSITDYVEVDLDDSRPIFGPSCQLGDDGGMPAIQIFKESPNRLKKLYSDIKGGLQDRWTIVRIIWPYMLAIALAYFVTLCLFPGIESEITSCSLQSWMPILVMAVFNLSDLIGKILAALPYKWSRPELVLVSISRVLLIPLMLFCATPRAQPLISNEGYSLVISAALGMSNGIFGSVPMMLAPTKVDETQKELAGNIMTLSYSMGLTVGSAVAYGLDEFIGPSLERQCP
eukprot:TCALIF_07239-PA protein Name:"Similar to slc29a4 Equilibrative nucleoside transporter 4 (Danio rerio)" AED:0.12 eAED:0.12 QI:0/0.57/0.25/0.87/1/1/8/0/535